MLTWDGNLPVDEAIHSWFVFLYIYKEMAFEVRPFVCWPSVQTATPVFLKILGLFYELLMFGEDVATECKKVRQHGPRENSPISNLSFYYI